MFAVMSRRASLHHAPRRTLRSSDAPLSPLLVVPRTHTELAFALSLLLLHPPQHTYNLRHMRYVVIVSIKTNWQLQQFHKQTVMLKTFISFLTFCSWLCFVNCVIDGVLRPKNKLACTLGLSAVVS